MDDEDPPPFDTYCVVRNDNNDHSIWPVVKQMPKGWQSLGIQGSQDTCLDWIEQNWAGPAIDD